MLKRGGSSLRISTGFTDSAALTTAPKSTRPLPEAAIEKIKDALLAKYFKGVPLPRDLVKRPQSTYPLIRAILGEPALMTGSTEALVTILESGSVIANKDRVKPTASEVSALITTMGEEERRSLNAAPLLKKGQLVQKLN